MPPSVFADESGDVISFSPEGVDVTDLKHYNRRVVYHNRRVAQRSAAVLAGTIVSLVIWTVHGPIFGGDLTVRIAGEIEPVGPVAVIAVSLLAGLAAWALLAVMERRLAQPRKVWTATSVAVLVLSLSGPLVNATDVDTIGPLLAMHATTGSALIIGLLRSRPRPPRGRREAW